MLTERFEQQLQQNLERYFPNFAGLPIEINRISESRRISATLFRYEIVAAGQKEKIIIKQRHPRPLTEEKKNRRPLRFQIPDEEKYQLEAQALRRIEQYFTKLEDSRFGAIRVLDFLPEAQAIIMIESQDPDLRKQFLRANRLQSLFKQPSILPIFENSGAWLKHYHCFPKDETVQDAATQPTEYLEAVQAYCAYLAEHLNKKSYFDAVSARIAKSARETLPESLPTGRAHNDFTMRNILVGQNGSVSVIDTLAKWQTAIYEDLAYFLLRLRTNQIQVFTQGLAYRDKWIDNCAESFLKGYFDAEPIPHTILDLYQALALLDQWTSQVESLLYSRKNIKNRLRLVLSNRHYQALLDSLLKGK